MLKFNFLFMVIPTLLLLTFGSNDFEEISKSFSKLREIQDQIVKQENARVHKTFQFDMDLNEYTVLQKKYLTNTWNIFSALSAYMESVLEELVTGIGAMPPEEEHFIQEVMKFLSNVALKAIKADTLKCKRKSNGKPQECLTREHWPTDCSEVEPKVSGITRIAQQSQSVLLYCEQDIFNGGWTLIWQSDLSYFKKFRTGSNGIGGYFSKFIHSTGSPCSDNSYNVGLELVHRITSSRKYELLIYYRDTSGVATYAFFEEFAIGSIETGYQATLLKSSAGNATQRLEKKSIGFRSLLPEISRMRWGSVKMLIRPKEINLNRQ